MKTLLPRPVRLRAYLMLGLAVALTACKDSPTAPLHPTAARYDCYVQRDPVADPFSGDDPAICAAGGEASQPTADMTAGFPNGFFILYSSPYTGDSMFGFASIKYAGTGYATYGFNAMGVWMDIAETGDIRLSLAQGSTLMSTGMVHITQFTVTDSHSY